MYGHPNGPGQHAHSDDVIEKTPKRKKKMKNDKLAVIVGRFQSESVCEAMDEFILKLASENDKVLILLGLSAIVATKENPLDFETRKLMLEQKYKSDFPPVGKYTHLYNLEIGYVKDNRYDDKWVEDVITQVSKFAKKNNCDLNRVTVYGGQHTFVRFFKDNKLVVNALPNEVYINEEANGNQVSSKIKATEEFRKGVSWAVKNQYPKVYPTVDVAVFDGSRLLLARKPNETKYRFIGGFVDPNETFETAAIREVKEESNIDVGLLEYAGSFVIPDWRYDRETDSVTTTLFIAQYNGGIPRAQDDIEKLKWVDLDDFKDALEFKDMIVDEHGELVQAVYFHYYNKN